MIDPGEAQAWTTLVASVVSLAGQARDLLSSGRAPEAADRVIELLERSQELRLAAINVGEENLRLRQQVAELGRVADLSARVVYEGEGVKLRDPGTSEPPGVCCLRCWEVEGRLASLYFHGSCRDCHDAREGRSRTRSRR
jgi:hypothetical protein